MKENNIKYICNKIKGIYYSDNKINYVEEILNKINNINLVNKYLLELSLLIIKAYDLNPITNIDKNDSKLVNEWDREYDDLCNKIIYFSKLDSYNCEKISKEDLNNLLKSKRNE